MHAKGMHNKQHAVASSLFRLAVYKGRQPYTISLLAAEQIQPRSDISIWCADSTSTQKLAVEIKVMHKALQPYQTVYSW